MVTSPALDAYRAEHPSHLPSETEVRAIRRRQNIEVARYPLWWAYWKARHLTWRQRRAIRNAASTTCDMALVCVTLVRHGDL